MNSTEMIPVESEAIAAVGYDGGTLTIQFTSGKTYPHHKVPASEYRGLMSASSKGVYYNAHIKGRYK